jgi:Ca2+-binding EF-hand superfamily protein
MDTVKELGWSRFSKKENSDISEMDLKAVFKLVDMDNSGNISRTVGYAA